METVITFVTLSVHEGTNADGKHVRFIRARFQVGENAYLTAFNPAGVAELELVKRVSRYTGKVQVCTRWPVLVRFQRDEVIGSNVVAACTIEPRAFKPQAMQSADAEDLAALDAAAAPAARPAVPAQAPSEPEDTEDLAALDAAAAAKPAAPAQAPAPSEPEEEALA